MQTNKKTTFYYKNVVTFDCNLPCLAIILKCSHSWGMYLAVYLDIRLKWQRTIPLTCKLSQCVDRCIKNAGRRHSPCLRLRDVRVRIRCLISYIFCNLLQLTSDWFNWSRETLNKILDFASFDHKLWSTVSEINKFTSFSVVCVVFFQWVLRLF